MPAAKPSEATIRNAISAAQKTGLAVASVRIGPDGSVTIETEKVDKPRLVGNRGPKKWGTG